MSRIPLAKMMVGNATLLSAIYLAIALCIEFIRTQTNARWARTLSAAMDGIAKWTLDRVRLSELLRSWYDRDLLSRFWLRVISGATTVAVIFAIAILVGLVMWGVRALVDRKSRAEEKSTVDS